MQNSTRHIFFILAIVISIHFILSFTNRVYGRATSLSNVVSRIATPEHPQTPYDASSPLDTGTGTARKANATFVILCRNTDLDGTIRSIREMEDRFNRDHHYPWVLLNEVPFTEEFKRRVSVVTESTVEFGLIPRSDWFQPDWIDESKASAARQKMVDDKIVYGGSVSYRNMCRFNSGFFFKQPLLQKYRYYWRVEPDVHFHCDVNYDPFLFMQDHNKTYGFTITMYEFQATIPTLWDAVKEFSKAHTQYIASDNALAFMSADDGNTYNLCHFWSNFEIADMDFWRGEAYSAFFEFLDSKGGFYYERWGDAPVHSIAAALFASRSQIHFFDDIGYQHSPYTHCPKDETKWKQGRCGCDPAQSFDYDGYSCLSKWERLMEQ